ncbi:MAG: ParB/RepB/Spo0J family partition protein [Firmicutes bacterium]|nr:ParB/RepB/Spo0J family partition protein [Bacillota bacterium]
MPSAGKIKLDLRTYDDIFSTQEERDEQKKAKIEDIPLDQIDDFPDHPYKVRDDEDMAALIESVREHGVITPATVRQKEDGRYELISGHRRKRACEILGIKTLRSEIVDLTRDQATVLMVESNFQRSQILPSEKAFAYRMRLEAMNRQGQRTDLTSTPVVSKLRSNEQMGQEVGESRESIRRYIRLTYLVPELLDLVDEGRMKMRPAYEISFLNADQQDYLYYQITRNEATPSHDQTIRMRRMAENGNLTPEAIEAIMSELKPNQHERITLRAERFNEVIPKSVPLKDREDYIYDALKFFGDYLKEHEPPRRSGSAR